MAVTDNHSDGAAKKPGKPCFVPGQQTQQWLNLSTGSLINLLVTKFGLKNPQKAQTNPKTETKKNRYCVLD